MVMLKADMVVVGPNGLTTLIEAKSSTATTVLPRHGIHPVAAEAIRSLPTMTASDLDTLLQALFLRRLQLDSEPNNRNRKRV